MPTLFSISVGDSHFAAGDVVRQLASAPLDGDAIKRQNVGCQDARLELGTVEGTMVVSEKTTASTAEGACQGRILP